MDFLSGIGDFLGLLAMLIRQLWDGGGQDFFVAVGVGLLLGGLTWWLAHIVAFQFNRQFSFRAQHHLYCGIAAAATIFFTVVFFALKYTGEVAQLSVEKWEMTVQTDAAWSDDTFRKAYEAVYALRDRSGNQLEDFTGRPHPSTGRHTLIPTNQEESKKVAAETYAEAAVDHFRSNHPFLSKILWARSGIVQDVIFKDIRKVFSSGRSVYEAKDAIQLAGREIRKGLVEQVPRVVWIARIILVVAFVLVQVITFALLIRAALADIKEKRVTQTFRGQ